LKITNGKYKIVYKTIKNVKYKKVSQIGYIFTSDKIIFVHNYFKIQYFRVYNQIIIF